MNSKPKKTRLTRAGVLRSGKIVGSLVITTCLFLGVVWLLGHFLLAKYPNAGTNIASVTSTGFDSPSTGGETDGATGDDATTDGIAVNNSSTAEVGLGTAAHDSETNDALRFADRDVDDATSGSDDASGGLGASLDSMASDSDSSDTGSRWNDVAATEPPTANSSTGSEFDSSWDPAETDAPNEAESFDSPEFSFDEPVATTEPATDEFNHSFETNESPTPEPKNLDTGSFGLSDQAAGSQNPLNIVKPAPETTALKAATPSSSVTGQLQPPNRTTLRPATTGSSTRPNASAQATPKPLKATTPPGTAYPVRTWTSSDRRQVDARFVSRDEKSVILSVSGRLYRVPLARLSENDVNYLKSIQDPALTR